MSTQKSELGSTTNLQKMLKYTYSSENSATLKEMCFFILSTFLETKSKNMLLQKVLNLCYIYYSLRCINISGAKIDLNLIFFVVAEVSLSHPKYFGCTFHCSLKSLCSLHCICVFILCISESYTLRSPLFLQRKGSKGYFNQQESEKFGSALSEIFGSALLEKFDLCFSYRFVFVLSIDYSNIKLLKMCGCIDRQFWVYTMR